MTDNKLTDKEIIKALEHHKKGRCFECPLRDNEKSCSVTISTLALDLINSQQAEIEEWKKLVEVWQTINDRDKAKIEYLARSNNMSQRLLFGAYDSVKRLDKLNETIKAEAIKGFAGKIADVFCSHDKGDTYVREVVYNLVKEVVGEK